MLFTLHHLINFIATILYILLKIYIVKAYITGSFTKNVLAQDVYKLE